MKPACLAKDRFTIDIRILSDGSLKLHRSLEADIANMRSNDARVHPDCALWVGTMAKDSTEEAGAIYWDRKGELKRLFGNITGPNAL